MNNCQLVNPLPDIPILGFFNSATNKDMMSKIWTNGVHLSNRVESSVEKREIAHYKQFLLFPQGFQKLSVVDGQNEYLWSKGLNGIWLCFVMVD